ncbi:MAG: hypothetical protein WCT77_01660, partial [Bacteroidota bacterium]
MAKKTIKDIVSENSEVLKAMQTHTELREWAIKQGFDNRSAFPKFKLALNDIGLDYDKIKTGIAKVKAEDLEKSIKYSLTLYSDAKASAGKFGITDKDGNVVWYGKFFDDDNASEQSRAELAAAKKAIWFASKVKESLGESSLMLNLLVDAEYLTYQTHSGQQGYALTQMANKYNIKLNVSWISGKSNPADEWTIASGFKKWQDNDFKSLVEPYESASEEERREFAEKLKNIDVVAPTKPEQELITVNICRIEKETDIAINVIFKLSYHQINYQKEIKSWLPKSQSKVIDSNIQVNKNFWNTKIKEIKKTETLIGIRNFKEFENSYSTLLLYQEPVIHSSLEPRSEKIYLNIPKQFAFIKKNDKYPDLLYFPSWLFNKKEEEIKGEYSGDIDYFRRNVVFNESDINKIEPEVINCNILEEIITDIKEQKISDKIQSKLESIAEKQGKSIEFVTEQFKNGYGTESEHAEQFKGLGLEKKKLLEAISNVAITHLEEKADWYVESTKPKEFSELDYVTKTKATKASKDRHLRLVNIISKLESSMLKKINGLDDIEQFADGGTIGKDLKITNYSEKSILVTGNTYPFKGDLKALGGIWNGRLKGWIFQKTKQADVENFVGQESEPQTESDKPKGIYKKLDLEKLFKSNTKPRKDVIIKEIEEGKMEYAVHKGFDAMTDSSTYFNVTNDSFKPAETAIRDWGKNKENFIISRLKSAMGQSHWVYSARVYHKDSIG